MGNRDVRIASGSADDRVAMRRVIRDLDALAQMIDDGLFEHQQTRRIGIEQELVLVDESARPARAAEPVLASAAHERIVPEIARFNIEINGEPQELGGDCFAKVEADVRALYERVVEAGRLVGVRPLMTGICPTVELAHLTRDNLMPFDRYVALDDGIRAQRGSDFELRVQGPDELIVNHPSVMLEAVNTSFQVHYQTCPECFARDYNVALAVAAPVLAAAANSPILFGKRLWRETRIAIFQQVVDTRTGGAGARESPGRVRFGDRWIESSVLEVLRADVSRFRQVLFSTATDEPDPLEQLERGETPRLPAWQAFNSSVYRWMRPCYGVSGGVPHLRIENRVFAAGPTIEDEIANAAFWIGLMVEGPRVFTDLTERLDFVDARGNFLCAARDGLAGHMVWLDEREAAIQELILEVFLPVARAGLERAGVDAADAETRLGIIRERVATRRTGARWLMDSAARLRGEGKQSQRLEKLARGLLDRQDASGPVHTWSPLKKNESPGQSLFATVSQCMTTDLFTVHENEAVDLVGSIMDWEKLRHIPVENDRHELIGLISYRSVIRALLKRSPTDKIEPMSAAEIMVRDPVTASPDTPTLEAIELMRSHGVSCLPVVEHGRLVGIVSERDYTELARWLLERELRGGTL